MSTKSKPQIVPTLVSSGVLVWSAVLVLLFLALLALYSAFVFYRETKAEMSRPVSTRVENVAAAVFSPPGWEVFSRSNERIELYRFQSRNLPFIELVSTSDEKTPYHALDVNSSLLLRRIASALAEVSTTNAVLPLVYLNGCELVTVKAGVMAVHFMFSDNTRFGEGLYFYVSDRAYFVWGLADVDDRESREQIHTFMSRPQNHLLLPDAPEDIVRPIVDSMKQTPETNRKTLDEVNRELAMWRLFAERSKTEPASSLLPAIEHFRGAVQLLSSIRQEDGILSGEDFTAYRALKERREEGISEWFVRLEKFRSMRDIEGARRQAQYIADHATLMGEARFARRARDILAEINAEAASENGGN